MAAFFDKYPDSLTQAELKTYFANLVKTHSWSTVRVDRISLQFFWDHTLHKKSDTSIAVSSRKRTSFLSRWRKGSTAYF